MEGKAYRQTAVKEEGRETYGKKIGRQCVTKKKDSEQIGEKETDREEEEVRERICVS